MESLGCKNCKNVRKTAKICVFRNRTPKNCGKSTKCNALRVFFTVLSRGDFTAKCTISRKYTSHFSLTITIVCNSCFRTSLRCTPWYVEKTLGISEIYVSYYLSLCHAGWPKIWAPQDERSRSPSTTFLTYAQHCCFVQKICWHLEMVLWRMQSFLLHSKGGELSWSIKDKILWLL